jgi:hypothetical protein
LPVSADHLVLPQLLGNCFFSWWRLHLLQNSRSTLQTTVTSSSCTLWPAVKFHQRASISPRCASCPLVFKTQLGTQPTAPGTSRTAGHASEPSCVMTWHLPDHWGRVWLISITGTFSFHSSCQATTIIDFRLLARQTHSCQAARASVPEAQSAGDNTGKSQPSSLLEASLGSSQNTSLAQALLAQDQAFLCALCQRSSLATLALRSALCLVSLEKTMVPWLWQLFQRSLLRASCLL